MSNETAPAAPTWNLNTAFRKTEKGVAEIQTRAYRLQPRLRSALILVDGRRRGSDLLPLIQQEPEATLHTLVEQGFIEPIPAAAPASASRPTPATPVESFAERRRVAVRLLNELLGPAAETLAIRMERTRSMDELQTQLAAATQAIGDLHGAATAAAFAARFEGR